MVPKKLRNGNFFKTFRKGKIVNCNLGINQIRKCCSTLAKTINLENSDAYTSHCMRRSGLLKI
jgi:hypothetical protein